MKKFFFFFIVTVILMQYLAFKTYGSFYWYLGDYLWYLFVFFALVNALLLTRKNAKEKIKDVYHKKLTNYKDNFLGNLKLDSRIYDVDPTDIAIINDQPIVVKGRQEHLEKMRDFLSVVQKINEKIEDHWPDEKKGEWWNDHIDSDIFKELKINEDDIEPVKKSKEALKFWLGNYNSDLKKMKEAHSKRFESTFEKGIIAMMPLIFMLIVAIQLGNVTNKLLFHVFGLE